MYNGENVYEVIESYLAGNMSAQELAVFEAQLANDNWLQDKLKVCKAAKVALMHHKLTNVHEILLEEAEAVKKKELLKKAAFVGFVATVALGAGYFALNGISGSDSNHTGKTDKEQIEKTLKIDSLSVVKSHQNPQVISQNTHIKTKKEAETHEISERIVNGDINVDKFEIEPVSSQIVDNNEQINNLPLVETDNSKTLPLVGNEVDCSKVRITANLVLTKACENDGSIVVSEIKGGSQPYTFAVNDNKVQNNGKFTNLPTGTYNLVVIDKNNCKQHFENIKVEKKLCNLNYDFNANRGEVWEGPEVELEAKLTILDKNGMLVYSKNLRAGEKPTWDAHDLNNILKFGYFVFLIQNSNNEVIRGSITVTE